MCTLRIHSHRYVTFSYTHTKTSRTKTKPISLNKEYYLNLKEI